MRRTSFKKQKLLLIDLEYLIKRTEIESYRRRYNQITCGDIMSKDIKSVKFETSLSEAWVTLKKHKIKALPVLNNKRCIIGIITLVDFMVHAKLDFFDSIEEKLRSFMRSIHPCRLNHKILLVRKSTPGHRQTNRFKSRRFDRVN